MTSRGSETEAAALRGGVRKDDSFIPMVDRPQADPQRGVLEPWRAGLLEGYVDLASSGILLKLDTGDQGTRSWYLILVFI